MKYAALIVFGLLLSACGDKPVAEVPVNLEAIDEMSFDDLVSIETDIPELADETGFMPPEPLALTGENSTIVLDNFKERQMIESPLTLSGKAPRAWFFEGNFPVTLMTLEENIVKEWYAEGAWLDMVEGSEVLGADDMIPFTATIDFEAPAAEVSDMGKIRLAKNLVAEEDVPEYLEVMILWP